jgi:hypothetical protein
MVFGSDGMNVSADGKSGFAIMPADTLKDTSQKFVFKVDQGSTFPSQLEDCATPYVQLGDEATLAPGVARDHSHGELHSDYERH